MCYIIILVFSSSDTGDRMEDNEMVEHWNQFKLNSSLILPVKPAYSRWRNSGQKYEIMSERTDSIRGIKVCGLAALMVCVWTADREGGGCKSGAQLR